MSELVSIIIPAYNREQEIRDSIESVLNQTYKYFEIIVIDDCSTDNTVKVVKSIKDSRIRIICLEENKGACYARNVGIDEAKGSYIAFLDSDDQWEKDKLRISITKIEEIDADVLIHAYIREFKSGKKIIGPGYNLNNEADKKRSILFKNCVNTPCLIGKKEVFQKNKFDDKLKRFQDWDLGIRLLDEYKIVFIDDILLKSVISENSLSTNMESALVSLKSIMEKNIEYVKKDDELYAHFYSLMGDFAERDAKNGYSGARYYKESLNKKFNKKCFVKYILSSLHIYKPMLRLIIKIGIKY